MIALPASRLQKTSTEVPGLPETAHTCGKNSPSTCWPPSKAATTSTRFRVMGLGGGAIEGSDTLTLRRASNELPDGATGSTVNGRLQLLVSRLSPSNEFLFNDGTLPALPELKKYLVQVRDLLVHTYYISKSSRSPDVENRPALRMKVSH